MLMLHPTQALKIILIYDEQEVASDIIVHQDVHGVMPVTSIYIILDPAGALILCTVYMD